MRRLVAAVAAAGVCVAGCGSSGSSAGSGPTVKTASGTLRGVADGSVTRYLGVRFAAPAERFAPPRPVKAPSGTVDATKPGARCAQSKYFGTPSTTEDCLFLNVTVPSGGGKGLPVMLWWHGGGYQSGAGSDYDARRLAAQGHVIVVTANQRLGIFGYLGLPGMAGGGSLGFQDQLASLRWTHANATAFGGDPGNVTVFGQSSGALSACALLTSPAARGLYAKVAMSSGSCLLNWRKGLQAPKAAAQTGYAPARAVQALSAATAKRLGCSGSGALACMRKVPVSKLLRVTSAFGDQLAYGTKLLPRNPAAAIAAGQFARVPLLSGGNRDEARSFFGASKPITAAAYPGALKQAFGADAAKVAAEYPASRYASPQLALATVATDASWSCPTLTGDGLMAKRTRVFAYQFGDRKAPDVNHSKTLPQGAAHADDLPFLFDLQGKNALKPGPQQRLADRMVAAYARFARTGRPWQPYKDGPTVHDFDESGSATVNVAAEHHCDFWQTIN